MKEVVFELRGAKARAPQIAFIKSSRTLTSETVTSHVDAETAWELNIVRGEPCELAQFREALKGPLYVSTEEIREIQGGPSWLVYYFRWSRPAPGQGVSVRHLLFDHLPTGGILSHRVEPGKSTFSALGFDAAALRSFYEQVAKALGEFYDVHLVYMGEPRLAPLGAVGLEPSDVEFARDALCLGYFEEPRRITVRDLAEMTEASKTATAHRMRRIERFAIEQLLKETMGLAGRHDSSRARFLALKVTEN